MVKLNLFVAGKFASCAEDQLDSSTASYIFLWRAARTSTRVVLLFLHWGYPRIALTHELLSELLVSLMKPKLVSETGIELGNTQNLLINSMSFAHYGFASFGVLQPWCVQQSRALLLPRPDSLLSPNL